MRKLWQALPGALAGALIGAVGTGGDYAGAALGALAGFGASVKHELLKLWKTIPYVGATAPLPPKGKPPQKPGDDDEPPMGGAGGGLQGLPGAAAVVLALGLTLVGTTGCGLFGGGSGPDAPTAVVLDRDAALRLAFNSSAVALDFLDQTEAAYLDALATPTPEQLADARERVLRLKRVRAVLEVARDWLDDGKLPDDEGRKALADATELLRLAGDELESQGVKLPPAVRDGLAAAAALLGGES